ncbi:hypothetical protein QP166_05115 [Sphingomonas sp. LR60]|uniref:hypothetical protein n=1 Tax=Sphingomonas sp. LR60 TaxID=3050233 RepID=UPI002FE2CD5E
MNDDEFQLRCDELATSYLDHVLLILRVNDRGANLRDFLDPWWSFNKGEPFIGGRKNGNLSQRTLNNPCACGCGNIDKSLGNRLLYLDWISVGAQKALSRRVCKNKIEQRDPHDRLIVEHSVPFAYIVNTLFAARETWDRNSLHQFLIANFKRALITREEDALLDGYQNGRSLTANMPIGWNVGSDPYSRYQERGIIEHRQELH